MSPGSVSIPGEARPGPDALLYGEASLSPDGARLATGDTNNVIRVWDVASGDQVEAFTGRVGVGIVQYSPLQSPDVTFSPDGRTVASWAFDGTVRLASPESGHEDVVAEGVPAISVLAFSPDGRWLAVCACEAVLPARGWPEGTSGVAIWDVGSGAPWVRSPVSMERAGLVPDGFAWGRDGWYAAWENDGGSIAGQAGRAEAGGRTDNPVTSAVFSPDGRYVAWGGPNDKTFVNAMDSDVAPQGGSRVLSSNVGPVTDLAFSSDGRFLVTAGGGGAEIWRMRSGDRFLRIETEAPIQRVAFMPGDGRVLVVTEQDVSVHVLDPAEQIELARDRVTRSLTDEECREYLHVATCPAD